VCDDVTWVKGYLCGISCKEQHTITQHYNTGKKYQF
jgi:hypothetical protein